MEHEQEKRHNHGRRCEDCHETPCPELVSQAELMREMREDVRAMREILEFMRDTKGFIKTLRHIGTAAKWIATIGAGVGAVVGFWHWVHK